MLITHTLNITTCNRKQRKKRRLDKFGYLGLKVNKAHLAYQGIPGQKVKPDQKVTKEKLDNKVQKEKKLVTFY